VPNNQRKPSVLIPTHPRWLRVAITPVATLAALGLRLLLVPLTGYEGSFLLFFGAVMLSAWVGGNMAGVLATVLAAPLVTYRCILVENTTLVQSIS
jgi:hypothetical protein